MAIKLDVKDKKIIYELGLDSRQSYADLGKKVKVSKEVAQYRTKQLLDLGVIFRFVAIFNTSKLGYALHKIFIKLHNMNQNIKQQMVLDLKNNKDILWIAECDGSFDLGLMIYAKTPYELDSKLASVYEKYASYIQKKELSTNIKGEYFERKYLSEKINETRKEQKYGEGDTTFNLDEHDYKILNELNSDSRKNSIEIAKKLPIKSDAVRNRIKKLEQENIINSYSIILNNNIIGQIQYKILIELQDLSHKTFLALREFCIHNKRIVYMIKSLGRWDIELDIETETPEQYRDIMMKLYEAIPNKIKNSETLIIYKIHEYRWLPKV